MLPICVTDAPSQLKVKWLQPSEMCTKMHNRRLISAPTCVAAAVRGMHTRWRDGFTRQPGEHPRVH